MRKLNGNGCAIFVAVATALVVFSPAGNRCAANAPFK